MDKRETFENIAALKKILMVLVEKKQKADFLIGETGLVRLSGVISEIKEADENFIIVNEKEKVNLKDIIAVNGIFHSDYSEC